MTPIFVTGIGTGVGKTVISAILAEALRADYWKPIQAGLDATDTETVRALLTNKESRLFPEAVRLKAPLSPHAAAKLDSKNIRISDIKPPDTKNALIIEGAGGLLVPLNEEELMVDLVRALNATVVVVSRHY